MPDVFSQWRKEINRHPSRNLCLAKNISQRRALKIMQSEAKLGMLQFARGRLVYCGLPLVGAMAQKFIQEIVTRLNLTGRFFFNSARKFNNDFYFFNCLDADNCILTSRTAYRIGNDMVREPAVSFKPYDRKTEGPFSDKTHREYPSLVVEIGNRRTNLKTVLDKWINHTTVSVAIGLYLDACANLIFMVKIRDNPVVEISLAADGCNHCISLPLRFIFDRGMLPAHLENKQFLVLDLNVFKRHWQFLINNKKQ